MSVVRLSNRVRRDLTYLNYPPAREWLVPRYRDGARVLDVLIVGAGQGGLATAFGLRLERSPLGTSTRLRRSGETAR